MSDSVSENPRIGKELNKWSELKLRYPKITQCQGNEMKLEIGSQEVRLILPSNYPRKGEFITLDYDKLGDNFSWLKDIQNYIIENEPSLLRLLKHIAKIYNDSHETLTNFMNQDDEELKYFLEDRDLLNPYDIELLRLEKELSANIKNKKAVSKLAIADNKKTPILFTGNVPGDILLTELIKLMKHYNTRDSNIDLSPIDKNIYQWSVKFKKFSNRPLNECLVKLKENFGFDFVELEINFHDKFFPTYPPFVKIVKPRFAQSLMHRITNMKMLQLDYWTPARDLKYVINKLYEVINEKGVIETNSDMNDEKKFKTGAYHPLESTLVKLASLCDAKDEFDPLDKTEYPRIYYNNKVNNIKSSKPTKTYWKSGTGYGHSGNNNWDVNEYVQLQKEKDVQIQSILQQIINELDLVNAKDTEIYKVIQASYAIPFVKSYLLGTTLLEISKHKDLFNLIFHFLQLLATENAIFLFDDKTDNNLYQLLKEINKEATQVIKLSDNLQVADMEELDANIPIMINNLFEMISPCFINYMNNKKKYENEEKKKYEKKIEAANATADPLHLKYKESMMEHRFDLKEFLSRGFMISQDRSIAPKSVMIRLAKEYASLSNSLPIFFQSSIFVCADEKNTKCLRVCISGPNDTPYDSGLYFFDVLINDDYPQRPPAVRLKNNGGIRFNPNLYACGKVCLSLLGTWSGQGGEQWNQETSTLQQLFVSIQSQILIDHPVFNEPGWEPEFGTEKGNKKSKDYNSYIRYYNMCFAMIEILNRQQEYLEFKEVINKHFLLKKDYILSTCRKWTDESYHLDQSMQHNASINKSSYETRFNELSQLLDKLN